MVINPSFYELRTEYRICYDYPDRPGSGYAFPCDENGVIQSIQMQSPGLENLKRCESGENGTVGPHFEKIEMRIFHPALLKCDYCGEVVYLDGFTNSCSCSDYNMSGQRLAPRSQWGEETGESVSDILRIN